MVFTGPVEDRLLILELNYAYADAVMRGDTEAWGALWAEDSYWSLPEVPGHEEFIGRQAIIEGWQQSMEAYGRPLEEGDPPSMIYLVTPGAIEIKGDSATARIYTSDVCTPPGTDKAVLTYGAYKDQLIRIDGKCLFKTRIYKILRVS